jgi:hypothetical protein
MAQVEKSEKLMLNEFQRSIAEVPLEVYYQEITSDQYSSSGFQFNVKQPGTNALLDTDVWVKYVLYLNSAAYQIESMYATGDATVADQTIYPSSDYRFALRGGNVIARSMQNLSVQINNSTLVVQPYRFLTVLDRLYVSNDQSEHEFTGSGGRFDEGNHGHRTAHSSHSRKQDLTLNLFLDLSNPPGITIPKILDSFGTDATVSNVNHDVYMNMRRPYPLMYEFYNPGFSRRFEQFTHKCRGRYAVGQNGTIATGRNAPNVDSTVGGNTNGPLIFYGTNNGAGNYYYTIELWERLPIPIFKMYSNDDVFGVIPNITQMQIQGNFLTNMLANCFHGSANSDNLSLDWSDVGSGEAKLYLRWYTPPVNYSIPKEISLPYPKINSWSVALPLPDWTVDTNASKEYTETQFSQYNITLESIPDLLLIYVRWSPFNYALCTPDDYNLEITNLVINIDNASGKLNQINSMDLYLKWKKLLKHSDNKIIGYEEWKRYCCVACLKPDDYGVRYGPGYSNQTTLGITGKALNWHNNPSVMFTANEPLGNLNTGGGTSGELFITTIYDKNRFIIRADGTAGQEMIKMAVDFNMLPPASI